MSRRLFISLLIAAVLLAACTSPSTAPSNAASTAAPAAAEPQGCLGSASTALVDLQCREVTIAVENAYLPFNYILVSTGQAGGWDYDAWTEICTRLHCTPKFVEVAWDGMIQAVSDGQYDVAADGITITAERAQKADFSTGYIKIQQRLLVRKGETRFNSLETFAANESWVLGTQANTANYEAARKILPETRIKAFEQFPFAIQALITGDVDAVIIDEVAGMGYLGENGEALELMGPAIAGEELGFVFPKGSALVAPVNQALAAMQKDGTLEKLSTRYFSPTFKISNADIKTTN
ncbi:MAG TPA: ABC transporter substrate-binding protein [Anaerolineaceae bacterium]|nr:ABC transporter substrate-binding protein [Anaerolineaceae bacterium]HPN50548.1 ABC transporter substrate-binding protein [Anaerolineaceae bacterium]